ncbi:hypothetical protein DPMN_059443, partial [Dreissena polymorpha]
CWNLIFKAFANSLESDETPQNVASHQNPNCKSEFHLSLLPDPLIDQSNELSKIAAMRLKAQ